MEFAKMKRVIVESPFSGGVDKNVEYAQKCMRDCLIRNEAPYASHLLYTQKNVLDDNVQNERKLGIQAGFVWREVADVTAFYVDLGWSNGMILGLDDCKNRGKPYEIRSIPEC